MFFSLSITIDWYRKSIFIDDWYRLLSIIGLSINYVKINSVTDPPCRLVGDVLLATGFLSYLGPFNQNFRSLLLSRWEKEMTANKIPFSENLNLINMLTDAATVGTE